MRSTATTSSWSPPEPGRPRGCWRRASPGAAAAAGLDDRRPRGARAGDGRGPPRLLGVRRSAPGRGRRPRRQRRVVEPRGAARAALGRGPAAERAAGRDARQPARLRGVPAHHRGAAGRDRRAARRAAPGLAGRGRRTTAAASALPALRHARRAGGGPARGPVAEHRRAGRGGPAAHRAGRRCGRGGRGPAGAGRTRRAGRAGASARRALHRVRRRQLAADAAQGRHGAPEPGPRSAPEDLRLRRAPRGGRPAARPLPRGRGLRGPGDPGGGPARPGGDGRLRAHRAGRAGDRQRRAAHRRAALASGPLAAHRRAAAGAGRRPASAGGRQRRPRLRGHQRGHRRGRHARRGDHPGAALGAGVRRAAAALRGAATVRTLPLDLLEADVELTFLARSATNLGLELELLRLGGDPGEPLPVVLAQATEPGAGAGAGRWAAP